MDYNAIVDLLCALGFGFGILGFGLALIGFIWFIVEVRFDKENSIKEDSK